MVAGKEDRVDLLLRSLGIDPSSFDVVLEWILCERLVAELAALDGLEHILGEPDELKRFRDLLDHRTGRHWSLTDTRALRVRVKAARVKHERRPIPPEEALLLRLSSPLRCVYCDREPPKVVLHIDHIIPASKGGVSTRENLQFLCAECNLRKSNKREVTPPWLELT